MDQKLIFMTVIGMSVVTFIPRLLPVLLLSTRSLPKVIIRWLAYIPVAVLAAMLFPSLFIKNSQIDISGENLFLWISVPTFLVAVKTRSLFGTVIAGMIMIASFRFFLGM